MQLISYLNKKPKYVHLDLTNFQGSAQHIIFSLKFTNTGFIKKICLLEFSTDNAQYVVDVENEAQMSFFLDIISDVGIIESALNEIGISIEQNNNINSAIINIPKKCVK